MEMLIDRTYCTSPKCESKKDCWRHVENHNLLGQHIIMACFADKCCDHFISIPKTVKGHVPTFQDMLAMGVPIECAELWTQGIESLMERITELEKGQTK